MKLKLDLYYVNATSYTMYQISSQYLRKLQRKVSSGTAEWNLTKLKLARKQVLNVLYQVCIFRADRKNNMLPAFGWLRHFRLLLGNWSIEFDETWHEAWAGWGKGVWGLGLLEKQR